MGQTERQTDRQTDRQTYATLLNAQADPAHHVGRDQASYFGLGPKSEAQRVESRDRVLGEEQPAPSPPARGVWGVLEVPPAGTGAEHRPLKSFLALGASWPLLELVRGQVLGPYPPP